MPLEKRGAALGGPFAFRRQRASVGAAMLEIASDKVAHIIIKAREYDAKVGSWDNRQGR